MQNVIDRERWLDSEAVGQRDGETGRRAPPTFLAGPDLRAWREGPDGVDVPVPRNRAHHWIASTNQHSIRMAEHVTRRARVCVRACVRVCVCGGGTVLSILRQSLAAAILHTTSKDYSCEHGPKNKTTIVDVDVPIGILGGPVECLRAVVVRPPARVINVMGNRVQQTRRLGRQRPESETSGEIVKPAQELFFP